MRRTFRGDTPKIRRVAVIAVLAIPSLGVAACQSATTATDTPQTQTTPHDMRISRLDLGRCFNEPAEAAKGIAVTIPCALPHDSQVYALAPLTTVGAYPGDDQVLHDADRLCTAQQDAVIEKKLPRDAQLGYFYPSLDTWKTSGDNRVVCYVYSKTLPTGSVLK